MILRNTSPKPFTFTLYHTEWCKGFGECSCTPGVRPVLGGKLIDVLKPMNITILGLELSDDLKPEIEHLVGAVRNALKSRVLRKVVGKAKIVEV